MDKYSTFSHISHHLIVFVLFYGFFFYELSQFYYIPPWNVKCWTVSLLYILVAWVFLSALFNKILYLYTEKLKRRLDSLVKSIERNKGMNCWYRWKEEKFLPTFGWCNEGGENYIENKVSILLSLMPFLFYFCFRFSVSSIEMNLSSHFVCDHTKHVEDKRKFHFIPLRYHSFY